MDDEKCNFIENCKDEGWLICSCSKSLKFCPLHYDQHRDGADRAHKKKICRLSDINCRKIKNLSHEKLETLRTLREKLIILLSETSIKLRGFAELRFNNLNNYEKQYLEALEYIDKPGIEINDLLTDFIICLINDIDKEEFKFEEIALDKLSLFLEMENIENNKYLEFEESLKKSDLKIQEFKIIIEKLENENSQRKQEIIGLKNEVQKNNSLIQDLIKTIEDTQKDKQLQIKKLEDKHLAEINKYKKKEEDLEKIIKDLTMQNKNLQITVNECRSKLDDLQNEGPKKKKLLLLKIVIMSKFIFLWVK